MPTLLDFIPKLMRESHVRYLITETLRDFRGKATIARARRERLKVAGQPTLPSAAATTAAAAIERDGFVIIPSIVPVEMLDLLNSQLDERLDSGSALNRVSNDRARSKGDERPSTAFLSDAEVSLGQTAIRNLTNYASIRQPFVDCPAAVSLAFLPLCDEIASTYLGARAAVGGVNLRKSFVNDIPEFDTLLFHVDPNSPKFLKFFFYLHDVGPGGGAFCYVRGSHRRRFLGWTRKYRWTRAELLAHYDEQDFVHAFAQKGDLIVADTNGFHAGTKPTNADRSMLTTDYLLHRDFYGDAGFQLSQDMIDAHLPQRHYVHAFLKAVPRMLE